MTASPFALAGRRIFVAGHNGMVGRALVRRLEREPATLLTASRDKLDLTDARAVGPWMEAERPDVVVIAAAKVGGILANQTYPVDFLEQNLLIQTNLLRAAHHAGVERLLFLGSSCIYPRDCPQPIKEEYLLSGPLEPSNDAYALAKIAGVRLVQAYRQQHGRRWISAMPTNLYGPFDNFDPTTSHVLPALVRRFKEAVEAGAQSITIWGTGAPRRELLHVDDLADASVHLLAHYDDAVAINVGCGADLTIRELAEAIAGVTGFSGDLVFDASKPDGTPRKLLDTGRLAALGWRPSIALETGLAETLAWFEANRAWATRSRARAA